MCLIRDLDRVTSTHSGPACCTVQYSIHSNGFTLTTIDETEKRERDAYDMKRWRKTVLLSFSSEPLCEGVTLTLTNIEPWLFIPNPKFHFRLEISLYLLKGHSLFLFPSAEAWANYQNKREDTSNLQTSSCSTSRNYLISKRVPWFGNQTICSSHLAWFVYSIQISDCLKSVSTVWKEERRIGRAGGILTNALAAR